MLILLIYLIQMFGMSFRANGNDFSSYLISSEAILTGTDLYDTGSPFPFNYPLFLYVALILLTILPYWLSNLLWFAMNVAALYASFSILFKLYLRSLSFKEIAALFVIPFIILTNVIQNNVPNGQVNFIVLLLCVLFLKYCVQSKRLLASIFFQQLYRSNLRLLFSSFISYFVMNYSGLVSLLFSLFFNRCFTIHHRR